jgi:hypothetical protein
MDSLMFPGSVFGNGVSLTRAEVMLEDKCQELLRSDRGSSQERDGFIHGMKEALFAAKLKPERFREGTPNDDGT